MARPLSRGIEYYPLDVDFMNDIKIRKIMKSCGPNSIAIIILLLGNIYKDEGYFMKWDEDVCFLVADAVGAKEVYVKEVLKKCLQVDLFSNELFKKYKIITSKGIQKRFFEITKRRKRENLIDDYLLVNVTKTGVIVAETPITVAETGVIVSKSTQSKVKESKVKDSVSNNSISLLNSMLKIKVDSNFLTKINSNINVNKLIEELSKSKWVCDNFDLNTASNSFLVKLCDGKFRDFKPVNKNKFKNFKQITDSYSAEDLEEMAMQKQKAGFEKLGVDI
ncbi:DUF4373 domain-containing protein [Peptoniphilus rhinitidis]|uniref:DUF4373 domain-containing protein n=1 Tax=Peptoniphilus rhinitidis TaxID=1175452 RepID=UPI000287FA8E|nr:DUF4373 domain-containing protein [Peptoniphilus rhinitidis]DAX73373.1 MAG TPA: protein of unknown function (DUF4373) [Caudoviricetes sp.]